MESLTTSHERLITLAGVGHWFVGTEVLFDGLYARFTPGTITGVCGPSGCGKSTLLTLIAGWEAPRHGIVTRSGVTSIAWVFQNPLGVPRRTALDHVGFPLLAKGYSRGQASEIALEIIRHFGLEDIADRPFSTISGGEAQRLLLARALAVKPDALLIDEPTAQLDRRSAVAVNNTLGMVASRGAIVVVATHDPATQAKCDSIIDLGTNSSETRSQS